jgi:DNA-binding SARP family transcriptional activator/TolB-like protein
MGAHSDLGVTPALRAHAYKLRTLGALDLRSADGRDVRALCTQPKRLTLLIYLALAGPGCFRRRDTIAALFWPDADTEHARASLRQALRVLRRELGDAALCVRGEEEIGVSPDVVWCDALAFAASIDAGDDEQACALFRGEFLDGLFVADAAPELEEWIAGERDSCRRRVLAAMGRVADRASDGGRHAEALAWAQRAAALDPLSEATAQRLIALHDAGGDRAGAVQAYEALADRMERELGVKPAPKTQALVSSIRVREIPVSSPEPVAGASERPAAGTPPFAEERRKPEDGARARRPIVITWLVLAASVMAALALAYLRGGGEEPLRPRVAVVPFENRTGNQAHDPVGRMAADWISHGLTQTGLVDVVSRLPRIDDTVGPVPAAARFGSPKHLPRLAERSGADVVVTGAYYRQRDSLGLQAQVFEAGSGKVLRSIGPISIAAADPVGGIDRLRERLMGTFALLVDRRFREWARTSASVPTYEAYREFVDGVDSYQRADWEPALTHLRRATVLDPSFTLARIWLAEAHMNAAANVDTTFAAPIDSLFSIPDSLRDRLPPLDRAVLDFRRAQRRADWAAGLEAARTAATLWPDRYALNAAMFSLVNLRPREAVRWFQRIDPEHGYVTEWSTYWHTLATARHWLGEHREELADARRARRRLPDHPSMVALEAQALIGLGQAEPGLRIADSAIRSGLEHGDAQGALEAAYTLTTELHAHRQPVEARRVAASALDAMMARMAHVGKPDTTSGGSMVTLQLLLALAYRAERWEETRVLAESILVQDPLNFYPLARLATMAARRGDLAEAERLIQVISTRPRAKLMDPYSVHPDPAADGMLVRARVAALLGRRDEAVRFLDVALKGGVGGYRFPELHNEADFQSLSDYPPFRALWRPKG